MGAAMILRAFPCQLYWSLARVLRLLTFNFAKPRERPSRERDWYVQYPKTYDHGDVVSHIAGWCAGAIHVPCPITTVLCHTLLSVTLQFQRPDWLIHLCGSSVLQKMHDCR